MLSGFDRSFAHKGDFRLLEQSGAKLDPVVRACISVIATSNSGFWRNEAGQAVHSTSSNGQPRSACALNSGRLSRKS